MPFRAVRSQPAGKAAARGTWSPLATGIMWELLCISFVAVAFLAAVARFLILVAQGKEPGLPLSGGALALTLLALGLTPWLTGKYRARQRRAFLEASEAITNDPRPRVLYLRPFKDDESMSQAVGLASVEQELCMVLLDFGPFVAFRGPGEFAEPGAARISVPYDKPWQEEVREQMAKARLVVMRVGNSDGFLWEAEQASEILKPEQLVFWVPEGEGGYEKFEREAQKWLPRRLPPSWPPRGSGGGIIYFEPDWTPHFRKFKTIWLRQTFWNLFAATLKIGLRPVYEQLGVEWRKPPVQPMQVLYMLTLALLAALVAYCVYALLRRVWLIL